MRRRFSTATVLALAAAAFAASPLLGRGSASPVDPRAGGFEVAMGEWTLVGESKAIRPGVVTFVVANRGRFGHGFRIREEGVRGRDRFEARTRVIDRGETAKLTVDLKPGTYSIECFVEDSHGDHEELGMRAILEVREDAPFVNPAPKPSPKRPEIRIEAFKFQPTPLSVKPGTTVKWVNEDAAKHTVSDLKGAFSSNVLTKGQSYSRKFPRAGTFTYLCAVHPSMRAKLVVKR